MLHVPGSLNSKCIAEGKDPEVKIIQKWNGYRPDFKLLLGSFYGLVNAIAHRLASNTIIKRAQKVAKITTMTQIEKKVYAQQQQYQYPAISLVHYYLV